jgi:membrane protease YdiL (CAAX protease family)
MRNSILENGRPWETPDQAGRRVQFIEVTIFLFLIVPSMVLSFFVVQQGSVSFLFVSTATIVRDLSLVSLILYFIWRNREGLQSLGWTFAHGWRDIFLGILLFLPVFFAAEALDGALRHAGFSAPATPMPAFVDIKGTSEIIIAFIMVSVVAVAEETIFRGYLLLRFQKGLQIAPFSAALLSSVIFSLGHGYEGTSGVVTVGFIGLVFALVYQWRGSLVAPIVMHFMQDFSGIVLPPLLGIK